MDKVPAVSSMKCFGGRDMIRCSSKITNGCSNKKTKLVEVIKFKVECSS